MIIKSMSRKSKSFSQLFQYMKNGSSNNSQYDFYTQNVYSSNDKGITSEFLDNSKGIKYRKNGNYLFHEVISITKSKQLDLIQEKERLFDIVRYYAKARCNNNLAVGFLHDEKENNVHFHLMISSNEIGENKNQRLTKYQFNKVKKETEKYVIDKYPELEQDILINVQKEEQKDVLSKKGWEIKRKGGRLEKRERITNKLKQIFSTSHSKSGLFTLLSEQNIEMYHRGNSIGFVTLTDGKKYRLKTLGLVQEFEKIQNLLKLDQEQPHSKQHAKNNEKTNTPDKPRSSPSPAQETEQQRETSNRKEEIKKSRAQSATHNKVNSKDIDK